MSVARSLFVQSLIDAGYEAIGKKDERQYKQKLEELIRILGADDPDITGLRIEKIRRDKVVR